MFELLLQADKALAGGLLEQAEKTYWQLIELDPSNAIAVAGLARVAMHRGDARMAKDFAERALAIDPDSILAARILEMLEYNTPSPSELGAGDLPLLAVQQLEALSRRRTPETARTGLEPDGDAEAAGSKKSAGPGPAPEPVSRKKANEARGKTRPDQIVPLPAEPLKERRKEGRLAAAAAAAAAAAREPTRARHEPHHAMPVGRYHFDRDLLHAPPADEFSAAEMAAAVAAVDALDDAATLDAIEAADLAASQLAAQAELLGAVDATGADDSVALRIAMLAGDADLEAAEREAAEGLRAAEAEADAGLGEPPVDEFAAAEAAAAAGLAETISAEEPAAFDPFASAEIDAADAAETAAASEALHEVAAEAPDAHREPAPKRHRPEAPDKEAPSEEEAEAQALREAMAIVLAGDGEPREGDRQVAEPKPESKAKPKAEPEPEADADAVADIGAPPEAPAAETLDEVVEPEANSEPAGRPAVEWPAEDRRAPDSRPAAKGGLFHRIKGS